MSNKPVANLLAEIIKTKLKAGNTNGKKELEKIAQNIGKLKQRLKNAKDLMLDGEFSAAEYRDMKIEIESEIDELNRQELNIRESHTNYDAKIDDCVDVLLNLDRYFVVKNTEVKQRIIGSMFPEKLYFKDNQYRTTKINEAVELFSLKHKGLGQKKGGKKTELSVSSLRVVPVGERSYYEVDDFHKILEFTGLLEPLTD